MTRGVNKVILIGNVGKDPQVRYLPSGGAVTNLTLATTDIYNDKTTGERKERTEWHQVVMFNKLAEIAGQYLKKGSQVYFEGSLRTRKWQDQNGNDRYSTEIVADQMQLLGGRGQGGEGGGGNYSRGAAGGADALDDNYSQVPPRANAGGGGNGNGGGYGGGGGGGNARPAGGGYGGNRGGANANSAPRVPEESFEDDDIPF